MHGKLPLNTMSQHKVDRRLYTGIYDRHAKEMAHKIGDHACMS